MCVEEGTFISSHKGELLNSKSEWHQAKVIRTTTRVVQGGADTVRQLGGGRGGRGGRGGGRGRGRDFDSRPQNTGFGSGPAGDSAADEPTVDLENCEEFPTLG